MGDSTAPSPAESAESEAEAASPAQRRSFWERLTGRIHPEHEEGAVEAAQSALEAVSDRGARAMLVNLNKMRTLRVEDVAVPRADIVAIPETASLPEIVDIYRESTLTRLPVYGETLDDPLGFLNLKDLALKWGFGAERDDSFEITPLLRRILYVPPSMPIGALLQRMQSSRTHMALVIDEYGGVDGLVTMEDLVEQIVGDIEDEHDEAEDALWREEAPGCFVVNARAELQSFEDAAGVDLLSDEMDEEVDTMGGLVFRLIGRIPERAEIIAHPDGHEFEVIEADPRKIKRLRVRIRKDGAPEEPREAAE
ncbi:MAG: hemolysin family protein [Rubricella sp.]